MGELIDQRYEVLETLGTGGMAEVFLAHDTVLGRDVALKVLDRRYSKDEEFVERFRREAQSAAALSHPNIVSVFDRGEAEDGTCYIAMEHVPRGTLKDRMQREGRFDARTALGVAVQIAEALGAAHERGVIHRDIKPQNVLVTARGDVKVADFGIARAASSTSITRESVALGTAAYMAPEQASGGKPGPMSDLYSLGVVMYEMLTGELPYKDGNAAVVAAQHARAPLRPPEELNPEIPAQTSDLVTTLLAKDPDDRPASTEDLIPQIHRLLEEPPKAEEEEITTVRSAPTRPTVRHPETRGKRPGRSRPRPENFVPWLLVLLFVLGVILGGIMVLRVLGAPLP